MTVEKYLRSCPNCGRHAGGKNKNCIGCGESLLDMRFLKKNIDNTIKKLDKAESEVFI